MENLYLKARPLALLLQAFVRDSLSAGLFFTEDSHELT